MFKEANSCLCSGRFFPAILHKDTDAWCFLNSVLCERSGGEFQQVFYNFTGLRNSRFTGNTDHLAQACDRPEVGKLSPNLLTTSLGLVNRWDCQGECAVPEGGFAVIDQWNSDSASPVCLCEFTCACSFSVLTLTVCACTCMKRVLLVWKASPALRSMSLQASWSKQCHLNCAITNVYIKSPHYHRQKCKKGAFTAHLEHLLSKSSHCVNVCLIRKIKARFDSRKCNVTWDGFSMTQTIHI